MVASADCAHLLQSRGPSFLQCSCIASSLVPLMEKTVPNLVGKEWIDHAQLSADVEEISTWPESSACDMGLSRMSLFAVMRLPL